MKISNLLYLDIDKNGIGDICLGMILTEFVDTYINTDMYYNSEILEMRAICPDYVVYTFFDSVDFLFSLRTSLLERITVHNNYKGSVFNSLKLGSRVSDIRVLFPKFEFDDDIIYLENDNSWVNITVSDDITILDTIEEIDRTYIEQISLRIRE